MAGTVTLIGSRHAVGDQYVVHATYTFDDSYPTGGEVLSAAEFGLTTINNVHVTSSGNVATKRVTYVPSTGALLVFVEDGTTGIEAQAANTSDQSALSCQVAVYGK